MAQIKIREICPIAMTEEQGLSLRSAMEPLIDAGEPVILDFEGISLFATMFFNASIGYYVLKKGAAYCSRNIQLANISSLGRETYRHSFANAKEIKESFGAQAADSHKIVEANIEES